MSDAKAEGPGVDGLGADRSGADTVGADSVGGGAVLGGTADRPAGNLPPMVLSNQYVRDLVFRVPGAPGIYAVRDIRPHIALHIDVQLRRAQEGHPVWEVALILQCQASAHSPVEGAEPPPLAFTVDLAYCGIFTLQNVETAMLEPMLLAECPRLLFPFARAVLADVTREAGFPPVLLQPFDFNQLWHSKRAARQAQEAATAQGQPVLAG